MFLSHNICFACCFDIVWHRRHKKKDPGTVTQTDVHVNPDVELEPAQGEIESLPVFPKHCLKLQRLLGSGAFGESMKELQLAAKLTLRKDVSDYEITQFLKESYLMSQFNHPNILRLLGVCLLNEPHYLILEMMDRGDLRSYLRGARPTTNHKELLNLTSLLDISFNAAAGCAYLERMHFVHILNCLVSVRSYTDPERVVKIGDFGLARDVYKNDYYRKKVEDGIFNKYSDVWAFGVLLWEIMTLGKYNIYFFCRYNLMMSCWSKEPTERPNFQYLKETLSKLRDYESDKKYVLVSPEEVCTGVDGDEDLETGLSPVLSNEALNYLMYRSETPDSVGTDSLTPTEDK
uniref:receptor protein-tyrosine kinase n=1 Tax=Sinocyclocheilus rhinocerous TaxID=307959 RepID=A0A673FQW6_9TELE